jgi:hypothetical protein
LVSWFWPAATSAFVSRPTSLLASIKVSVLSSQYLCYLPVDSHHQRRPEADVSHLVSPIWVSRTISMAYSKAKLKSSGDRASHHFG